MRTSVGDPDRLDVACSWRLFIDARTPQKAERVLHGFLKRLREPTSPPRIERHHDGYFLSLFETNHRGTWPEIVLDVIEFVQCVGGAPKVEEISNSLSLWCDGTSEPGCYALQVYAAKPA